MSRLRQTCLAACATALLIAAAPVAAAPGGDCLLFSNLKHCPLGDASLAASKNALQVSGVGSEAKDGVAVALPDVRNWSAGVQLAGGDTNPHVILGAATRGEEISRAEIVGKDGGGYFSASFTGADGPGTHSILVYRKGNLVGSQGGLDSPWFLTFNQDEDFFMWLIYIMYSRMAGGGGVWTYDFPEPLHLVLPDGTRVEGDEIHFVEEAKGDGPGVFDGIAVRSSRNLQILSEEAH